jgi:SAM-dependent methyltransferase
MFKKFLKKIPIFVKVKNLISPILVKPNGNTELDILAAFPLYAPFSAGSYEDKAILTIECVNQTLPFLNSLTDLIGYKKQNPVEISNFPTSKNEIQSSHELKKLLDSYGSDKANQHNYHYLYGAILSNPGGIKNIFEVGLGTNNTDVTSNMGEKGRPGASLRAFRDFCPDAKIYGADIDRRVLFKENRIETYFIDQTKPLSFEPFVKKFQQKFDLVIDDGLHSPNANIQTLAFGLQLIKKGGWVVIEDINPNALHLWQIIASILPKEKYESHILSAIGGLVFAVKLS